MIAGCGTLLPTRSIQPRKPPPWSASSAARPSLIDRPPPAGTREPGGQLDEQLGAEAARALVAPACGRRVAGRCRRCRRGPTACPSTNSSRNSAAVIEPALMPPMLVMSAIEESSWAAVGPVQRELPDRLVGDVAGGLELVDQLRVVAHHPGDLDTEGAQAGAGQGGDVDDGVDVVLDGQAQPVGHHQASLGVGVEHLDGRAVAHRQHVAQLHRRARRHVVGAAQVGRDGGRCSPAPGARSSRRGSPPHRSCRSSSGRATRRSA